jgi:hypothetical protein
MGRLKDIINKIERRKNKYGGSLFGSEMVYNSSIVLHQLGTEIHLGKNRSGNNGFVTLPELIKIILNEYSNGPNDGDEQITPSKMFDTVIIKEIQEAVDNILIKHKLSN